VSKAVGTTDPRIAGSRNVGFNNVLRVGGKQAGILTLIGDMGKGWVVAWLGGQLLSDEVSVLIVTSAVIAGHLHSVFLQFQGGKGVATALGAVLGVAPMIGLSMLAIWLLAVALWRYSSGGALAAFGSSPLLAILFEKSGVFIGFASLVSAVVWLRHRENVIRLWSGRESQIGQGSKS
jgi:acyl phosphate:glycerol-3-phosphate acyltransferase